MKYALDTSVWFRAATEPESIPREVKRILGEREEVFGLSAISLWEIGKKHQLGRLKLAKDLLTSLKEATGSQIEVLPITPEIVAEAMGLQRFPNRDPADELVVATARIHRLILITTDTLIKGYPHAEIYYFKPIIRG